VVKGNEGSGQTSDARKRSNFFRHTTMIQKIALTTAISPVDIDPAEIYSEHGQPKYA
jgi:hypothetical protein